MLVSFPILKMYHSELKDLKYVIWTLSILNPYFFQVSNHKQWRHRTSEVVQPRPRTEKIELKSEKQKKQTNRQTDRKSDNARGTGQRSQPGLHGGHILRVSRDRTRCLLRIGIPKGKQEFQSKQNKNVIFLIKVVSNEN